MGFSRQEYWRGWPFPSPGDLADPGVEPGSPALQADSLLSESHIPNLLILMSFMTAITLLLAEVINQSLFWGSSSRLPKISIDFHFEKVSFHLMDISVFL